MDPAAEAAAPAQQGALRSLLRMLLLAGLLLAAGIILRRAAPGLLESVRPTAGGAALLVAGGAMLTAVGLPRQAVAFAGGYAFGASVGSVLALVAQLLGCAASYTAARFVAGRWAQARLARAQGGWLARSRALLGRHPFNATVALRLLPVSNNLLLNLLAGMAHIRPTPFLLGSAVGYLPQTVIFALLGSGAQLGEHTKLAVGAVLFFVSAGLGFLQIRWAARQANESGPA